MEERTATLLCGDLFTQGGAGQPPLTESDILGPERGLPPQDGLLLAHDQRARDARAAGRADPDDARVHARQRVARRRGGQLLRALADALSA